MSIQTITGRDTATGRPICVTIAGEHIAAIEPAIAANDEDPWLAPGPVDLQVNGYGGYALNPDDLHDDTVFKVADAMLGLGVTRFVPTLITNSEAAIISSLRVIADARSGSAQLSAMMPYVHIEGPHISPADGPRGAHPKQWVRSPDLAEFARWQAASGGLVGMITLSPHDDAALRYIAEVTAQGVHVAIGHSDASADQIRAAAAAGAALSTHLGNGLASPLERHPNLLWAQLADDRLTATFIADGHHLPADTLRAMIRAKGVERAILVSDAVALAGRPAGDYDTPIGGRVTLTDDGRLGLSGTPFLAGAARPLIDCIAWVVRDADVSLADAVRMATANPAQFAGGGGELAVGARADMMRFRFQPDDSKLVIDNVWLGGRSTASAG
jgi:N-acetylglucosamine-6-phosphate deacetylase